MKMYRLSGLILAAFCCVTLIIAAAGATTAPEQGPEGRGSGHGFAPANMSEQGLRVIHGNSTGHGSQLHYILKTNITAQNSTIPGPDRWNSMGHGPENMTELQGNFTSPPPMPENRTLAGSIPGETLVRPDAGMGNSSLPVNASSEKYDINMVLDQGNLHNSDEIVEAFLSWLRSFLTAPG
jgi:hypothetical protein